MGEDAATGSTAPAVARVWSDEAKALVFEVWMGPGGRNVAATVRLVNAPPSSLGVAASTVYDWVRSGGWHEEADRRLRSIAPRLGDLIHGEALAASLEAVRRLSAILGDPATAPGDVIRAARTVAEIAGIVGRAGSSAAVAVVLPSSTGSAGGDPSGGAPASLQASRSFSPLAISSGDREDMADRLFNRVIQLRDVDPPATDSGASR